MSSEEKRAKIFKPKKLSTTDKKKKPYPIDDWTSKEFIVAHGKKIHVCCICGALINEHKDRHFSDCHPGLKKQDHPNLKYGYFPFDPIDGWDEAVNAEIWLRTKRKEDLFHAQSQVAESPNSNWSIGKYKKNYLKLMK